MRIRPPARVARIAFMILAVALPGLALTGCEATPRQQQANLDTKALAADVAAAIKTDPNLSDSTKKQAELVAGAVAAAIDAKGNVTPDSVAAAVLQSGAIPEKYSTYGVLALLAARMIQAQLAASRKPGAGAT
jgi:outer membrane murein-binding lipoprotein Lpp